MHAQSNFKKLENRPYGKIFIKTEECRDWTGQFYSQIPIEGSVTNFALCLRRYYQEFESYFCLFGKSKEVKMIKVKGIAQLGADSNMKFWWSYTGFFLFLVILNFSLSFLRSTF